MEREREDRIGSQDAQEQDDSQVERFLELLKNAYQDEVSVKNEKIQQLETKLQESVAEVRGLELQVRAAALENETLALQLEETKKQLEESRGEAQEWKQKLKKFSKVQCQLAKRVQSNIVGTTQTQSLKLDGDSEFPFSEVETQQKLPLSDGETQPRGQRSRRKFTRKNSGLSKEESQIRTESQRTSGGSQRRTRDRSADKTAGEVRSEDDTSPASRTKSSKLKSSKRERTRYREEASSQSKRARLSPAPESRATQTKHNREMSSDGKNGRSNFPVKTTTENTLVPDALQQQNEDFRNVDTEAREENNDSEEDIPNFIIPETVPADLSVIDDDDDDDDLEKIEKNDVNTKAESRDRDDGEENRPKKNSDNPATKDGTRNCASEVDEHDEASRGLRGKRTRSKRSNSTDDEITCSSPVFGVPAKGILTMPMRQKSSVESPSLFDDEDREKSKGDKVGKSNESSGTLNIKRKNKNKRSSRRPSESPVTEKTKSAKTQLVPLQMPVSPTPTARSRDGEAERSGDKNTVTDNREILHEIQNVCDSLDKGQTSAQGVGKETTEERDPPRVGLSGEDNTSLRLNTTKRRQKFNILPPDSPAVLKEELNKFSPRKVQTHRSVALDDSNKESPSVLTGKVRSFRTTQDDKWLRRPEKKTLPFTPPPVNATGETSADVPMDIETDDDEIPSLSKRTRKKNKTAEPSPFTPGRKLRQSTLSGVFFAKRTTDLSADPGFNGGNLSGSAFNVRTKMTPQEKEALAVEEAIKRSLEDKPDKQSLGDSEGQGQGHAKPVEGQEDTEGGVDSVRAEDRNHVADIDTHHMSELTGPGLTSTPCKSGETTTKKPTKARSKSNSDKTFKKPCIPLKKLKTPKKERSKSASDSPRRSPRLTRMDGPDFPDATGSEPDFPERASRRQLDSQYSGMTVAPPGDLNGSIDPRVRLSDLDDDRSFASLKSGTLNTPGACRKTEPAGSPVNETTPKREDSQLDAATARTEFDPSCQDMVTLYEINDEVDSVPMTEFLSQNPRSRATRVTPPPKHRRAAIRARPESEGSESPESDSDEIPSTAGSVVFGNKASPSQRSKRRRRKPTSAEKKLNDEQAIPERTTIDRGPKQVPGRAFEDSFDRVPKKRNSPEYKYQEVVRKQDERRKLNAHPCRDCAGYFREGNEPDTCRHRAKHRPPDTPEHYWEIGFADTPELRERGVLNTTQAKPGARRRKGLNKRFKTEREELEESQNHNTDTEDPTS